jgi:hypothetical protein
MVLFHEHFPYGLCNSSRTHAEALAARRAGKEIVCEYYSDSNTVPNYNSNSPYEFDFSLDPIKHESKLNPIEELYQVLMLAWSSRLLLPEDLSTGPTASPQT